MSGYYIKGQSNKPNGRIVVINETDWSVEINATPLPNYNDDYSEYAAVVTDSKKLVFLRESDGKVTAYGNVDPIYVVE